MFQSIPQSPLEKVKKTPAWLFLFGIFPAPAICFAQMVQEWLDFESAMNRPPDLRILVLSSILPLAVGLVTFMMKSSRKIVIVAFAVANLLSISIGLWLLEQR